jgi:hypothetical protein
VQLNAQSYRWRANHYKLRGRGKGAAERKSGADGIFQLEVLDESGNVLHGKGLLFQAKKEWRGKDQNLLKQVTLLEEYSPSAIVIDYRRSGFTGIAGREVIQAQGNRRAIPSQENVRLAEILGDEFVRCRRGDIGTFWNSETRMLEHEVGVRVTPPPVPQHVITTAVQRMR